MSRLDWLPGRDAERLYILGKNYIKFKSDVGIIQSSKVLDFVPGVGPSSYEIIEGYLCLPIVEVRGGQAEVFDLHVPGSHSFLANGLINHNTGRFSSADPNLQNLPARDKKKKRIRRVYTADPGEILISCDYGQVEPRITAEIANEEGMIKAFVENRDVYSEMASRVFNKTLEECGDGSQWRTMMKTLWLGILYGMTVPGLATRLMRTKDEAADILNDFFTGNPGIKETMDMYQRQVRQKGYIETLSGRKRRLPDIWSDEWWMRESVKRKILNSVIQGTAADVMKQAMVNVGTDKEIKYLNGRQLVTVHDELIVAAPKETAIEVARLVEINMIRVAEQFDMKRVPFKCDSEIYLDGRWSSQYVLPLKDIKSGKVKESEVNWMV